MTTTSDFATSTTNRKKSLNKIHPILFLFLMANPLLSVVLVATGGWLAFGYPQIQAQQKDRNTHNQILSKKPTDLEPPFSHSEKKIDNKFHKKAKKLTARGLILTFHQLPTGKQYTMVLKPQNLILYLTF